MDDRNRTRHPNYFQRSELFVAEKLGEALRQIDWNMMDKHLDTPEARSAFDEICKEVRQSIKRAAANRDRFKREDPCLQVYRERIYTKPGYSMMPFKWNRGKLPFKKGTLKIIGFGVPLVVASFIGGELVGARRGRSETGTVV